MYYTGWAGHVAKPQFDKFGRVPRWLDVAVTADRQAGHG